MCKIWCLLILLLVNFIAIIILYFFQTNFKQLVVNFEMGFLGFLLINFVNFLGLKKRIATEVGQLQKEAKIEEQKKSKPSSWILGIQIFMLWTRIVAYLFVAGGIYFLMHFHFFHFFSCIAGIGVSLISVLILQFMQLKKQ